MNLVHDVILWLSFLFYTVGWLAYLHSRGQRADLYTDLSKLIHDGTVSHEDLRRCLDHDEVQDALDRWDDDYNPRYEGELAEAIEEGEPARIFDE